MRIKERMKKGFSVLLALNMVLSSVPLPVFAAEDCTHHTEHTADCGYVAAVEGVPCTHVHDELCGYAEAVAEVKCACEATDENGALVHTEGCGYVAPVTGADCTHSHDDACGYVASVSGSDCTFHCHICHVQELVDALPGAVTAENAEAVEAQLTAIDNEKASLSDEELVQVDFAKYTVAAEGLGSVYAAVPATDFAVTIADGIENGIVAADVTKAAEGETVTLTVTANEGCVLDALTVTAENATAPTPVEAEGKYTFTMPAGNVTISATFKEVASGIQAGYYLVGTLNGKNKLSVDQDSSDRLLKEDTNVEGQYCLEYTFAAGDKLKIAYFDGQEITKWYKDDDFYPISEAKAGKCILLFRPEGNEIWSSTYFTVTPVYSVTVNTVENGAVTADVAKAAKGETVKLTVIPAEGYEIDTVSYNDGADHTIAPVEGVYSFTMPAGDVTVTATFKIPVCTCTDKCAEGSVNSGCAVCGAEGADLSACIGTETTASGVDDWCVVDTEAGTLTIDGTLGGKTDATEEDLTALVAALKSYVESGHTTIIVTGSQPAKLLKDGYLIPVVSLAFEQLTYGYQDEKIDSYWGTVDLIYQDVTEIVEYEFYVCDVLKSITLPKVTTVGDSGFWACYYLDTLTFGSVVTAINDNSGEVFYDLGYKIDGCNLALNCGQVKAETDYQPNIETKTWWKDNEWKSITLTHTEGTAATCIAQAVCSVCGDSYGEVDADAHSYGDWVSNGDGTHIRTCANDSTHTENGDCSGGTATCTTLAVCDLCGTEYGEPTGDHTFDETGKCVCSAQAAAKIGTTFYGTLAEAAEKAAENDTIYILTDVETDEDIAFAAFVTLDVAEGKIITCTGDVTIGGSEGIIFENELYYYGGDVTNSGVNVPGGGKSFYFKAGEGYIIGTTAGTNGPGTMKLVNATVNSPENYGIIQSNLTLSFSGTNTITATNEDENFGIYSYVTGDTVNGYVTLSGEEGAVLNIYAGDATSSSFGIYTKTVTITGGTVNIVSGNVPNGATAGISANSVVVEEGATLNMTIGKALSAIGTYGSISGGGTVNGLIAVPADNAFGIAFAASGKTVLTADFTASLEGMLLPFSVPADTSLTVNEGVTLDLSGLTLNDIDFSGEIINHGTILLPEGFVMDNAPEDGTITVGNKSYTWDEENDKWICNNENSHTGGTATCNRGKICDLCGTEYGEKSQTNHDESVMYTETDNGFCPHCGAYQSAVLNGDVYEISNAGQLYWFAAQVNSGKVNIHGKLMNNIVVNENVLNADGSLNGDGSGFRQWTPIGQYISETDNPGFAGTFNGNGKTIRGLYHYGDSAKYAGLFGYSAGTIRDLAIADAYIHTTHSDGRAGSVTGLNEGTVSNCHNSGFVGGNGQIGGIVGRMNAGTIENCSNSGTITGNSYVGGICGYEGGKIQNCSNSGTVNGNLDVGGIAGWNRGAIEKCSNSGTITGNSHVGGVAGLVSGGTINNCYNVGSVEATNECAGGIAGGVQNTSNISNCFSGGPVKVPSSVGGIVGNVLNNSATNVTITNGYYDNHVYSGNDIDTIGPQAKVTRTKVEGKTTEAFSSGEVTWLLNGESAEGVWKQTLNTDAVPGFTGGTVYYGYVDCGSTEAVYTNTIVSTEPVEHDYDNGFCEQVSGQTHYEPATLVTAENCTELGLADSYIGYYAITNAGQLYWIADKVDNDNANFGAAYVVLTDNITVNSGTLTANSADARVWNPIGWYTYRNSDTAVFSGTFDGNGKTVSGLYYNDSAKTSRYIGLVACVAEGGTVKHVTLSNSYISGYRYIGGIAGENYGTITGCVNNAAIGGEGEQGGIVGENYGTVELCGNTGTITNTWCYSGGIVGYSYGIIRNCWNTGSFSGGTSCAGGIVGTQEGRDSLTENCWSKGQVTGMSCGSISGWLNGAATVQNCYSDKDPLVGKRSSNNGTPITTNVQYKSTAAFASGEVAYLLRTLAAAGTNVWGQNLDNGQTVQTVPTFDGADVYCGYASCADTKVKYTNNASVSTTPIAHDWGCTATGAQIVGTCVNGCGTDGGKVTLTLDGTAVYDGTKKTVKAVGSLEGIDTLPGVTYAGDRINVGTFTADLTLEDGTKAQLEVTITAKEITPTVEGVQSTYSYNGEAIKPAVTVKDGETVLREGTNYDVTYGENTNCATGGSVKVTLKGNYEGSAEETFTITAKEITPTVEGVQSTYSYNGEVIKPTVTVKDGEIVLVEGVDYHITYGSNTNVADRGSVKVTLKGNYEGSAEETFAIAPKEVTELTFVGLNEVYAHTGEAIVPTFNVKDGETTLSEGMDYTAAITNNTDVGTATITITLKENYTGTVTKTFEIKPHVHEWNYELSGANTIVAKCSGTIGTCPVKTATIKIAAEDKTYDGNPVTATLTGKIDGVDTPAIRYFKNGAELNESVINAGTYTASIKLGEAEAKVNFTIAKAEIDGSTLINPEFAEGLIYNGTAQALVTKTGSVDGGYIVFSLNPDGEYTAEIPVATEAGKYVVFYRIEGDENHYWEGTSAYNTVTIAKANPEYTIPTGLTATYGDTLAKVELPTGWTWKDAETTSVGNAGTRTFKAIFTPADTGNYNTVETDVTVEVAKADPEYTVPTGLTATYGNTLADVELPAGWTWKDAETTSVGNAGTNTFQAIFTPADTTNYTVVESGVTITVAKATASVETAPAANTLIYTGEAQALVTAGAANNGEMQYSTDNRTWSTTIPTGTNAGDYTVYYKVVGDENHIDTDVQSVVVKIGQLAVAEPTVSGTYTYTGKEQMVTLTGVESYMTVVSGNKAVGAGSYEAVITLDGNHKWADGSDGKVQWSIGKAEFGDVYVSQSGMLTYNGTAQTPNVNTDADSVGDQTATFAYRLTENESYGEMPAFTDAGTYTVYYKASAPNHKDATGSFTVMVDKAKAEITVDTDPITVTYGDTVELPDATANFGTVSCDKTAAELVNVGTYTVTYTVAGTDNYDGDTKTVTVKINPKAITEDDVQLNGSLVYTGSEQTQQITVTAGIDFEVTGNKATNVGSYTLTVTASGNYTGSVTKDWSIKSAAAIVETAPKANNLTYTGEAQELVTAGTAKGGKLVYSLTEDGEYTETIPAGTNVGEYTVWYYVDGDYNHSDSAKASVKVTIAKAKAEISVDTTPITVTYGETVELPNATSSFGTVSCDKTADELVNAGTYTVTYTVEGTDNYEGDTKTVTVTIEKLAVAEPTVTGTYTYTGEEQTAQLTGVESCMTVASGDKATNAGSYEVEITLDGNHQWAEGSDGKVQWSIGKAQAEIAVNTDPITAVYGGTVKLPEATANFGTVTCDTTADKLVNAGTYTVTYTVASTANFDGDSKTVTVTVNPKAITEADVSLNGSLVYTGSELTQAVTVTAGVTYEVTGNKATNVGSYTLTVTASGNYTGSVTKDWSIGKAVATVETAPTAKELTYTGAAQALVTAGTANGGKLVYSLSENGIYAETIPTGTNAGDYMVWYYVQGDDNHADSAKASVKVTIAKAKAEISVNTTPITVTYGEAVMLPTATSSFGTVSRDKTAAELVNAGTYTVTYTVEGTANYEGDTKTLTVIVEKKAVAEPAVTGTYTYTGEEQTAQLTGVESCMTIASGDKATNAGSYEVVITLDGNHKWADGSDGKVQWSIGKAEFGDVYVSQSGMLTYNGTAQTPNVNTDADSVGDQTATFAYRLTENESYGEMPAFTDAGTYTVYYKASAPNHKDATGSFTVTVDKAKAEIAVNTDPITVVYGEAVVLPTATTNFGTVACDKTASDLVNAGTYTVTYSVVGSDNYNGDTKTITVTVNAKVVNQPVIEGIEAVYILSENAITPVPTAVKDGATVIVPSEYTLAYENNTAAGTATVKIVDKDGGNYTVNGSMTFQIVEHEHTWTYTTDSNASKIIATCSNADGHCPNTNGGSVSIQDPDELTYDGSTKDAELVYESWQPEEVTITYNNVDRVNVTGKEIVASIGVVGAGIQSVYTIVAAALPNATLSADSGTYTGQAHTVTVVLDTLVKDTDYTVSIPEDMTNVGTKTITVNGKGNYEGTQNLTYTITKRSDVAAPAPGVGYTIDYAKETITIAEGFEVIDSDGKAVVSGSAADYFGKMLSVRYAETQNTEASAYTSFTLAERPAVPNVTIHNETIKGKADGKITGLDTTMEYSTDGGKHWVSVETTDAGEKNLTVGTTIAVRMKATQTAPCSESKTGTVAAGAAITVTYAENGQAADGMPAQVSDLSYGNKLTKPADPTAKNTDFAFRGWYKDAACTTAWDFAKDTVTEETVTLYAKWEQVYFSVTAEIKDHNNVEYHGEVDVKLMRGDSTIDSVTGTAGSFQFSRHVEGGMYNLVAIYTDSTGEHTKTELITVDHDETFVLKLPAPGVNSHLTVSGNAQTPDVMVGELDAEAESIKQQTGATKVEIEMTVTGKTENQVPATVVNAVEEATDNAAVEYLDITVTKQIDDGAKTEMSETTNLMEIVVPYNTNGKTNLRVFRHHDGQLQEFAQGRDADQTFYYASGYIHIFTKYFSNYMISYEVSHTVTFDANGGTVGTNSLTTQTNGTLSTLPTPTREHYVFKGWYTAKSGGTKVTTDTVFNGDATIYAQWGGYAITVADAKNGTVTVDRSEAPGATEITITVTPKTGYKLSALTVKDAAGKSYVISTDNNGKYYFTMPDADVTVKVTFSKISTSTADTTNPKTGDGFQLVPFSSVAATSLLALAVLMLNKKKLYQK